MIFISYSHKDNDTPTERWVSHFHDLLAGRLRQLFGSDDLPVFRDASDLRKLPMTVSEEIEARLRETRILLPIASPSYLRSDWCTMERRSFLESRNNEEERKMIFGVEKIPVMDAPDFPKVIADRFVYKFYKVDAERKRAREIFPDEKEFRQIILDLADDIKDQYLALMHRAPPDATSSKGKVYLASCTSDLRHERDEIRRELVALGYTLVPAESLPYEPDQLEAACREHLEDARISIHLLGKTFGFRPENSTESVQELEYTFARKYAKADGFIRFVWARDMADTTNTDQRQFYQALINAPEHQEKADRFMGDLSGFKEQILESLIRESGAAKVKVATLRKVFLAHWPEQKPLAGQLKKLLHEAGFEPRSLRLHTDDFVAKVKTAAAKGAVRILLCCPEEEERLEDFLEQVEHIRLTSLGVFCQPGQPEPFTHLATLCRQAGTAPAAADIAAFIALEND